MIALFLALVAAQPTLDALLPSDPAAPGCALDVRRDGAVVAARAVGRANLETVAPITERTVFEIGSISKQFIGAGLALLAGQGRLSLDDPVRKWLPELPPLYRGVTVAMLAHHTSGIRSWNNLAELTGRGEDSTGYDNRWVLDAVARQHGLNNTPGAEYLYSNSNFVLAAIIIERASGEELNAFYRHAFFDRLGMSDTRWRTDFREIVPGRAQAYGPAGEGRWRLDMPLNGVAGAGGLLSTVGDLQRWNAALAAPGAADRDWVAALQRPGKLSDGTPLRYGMGVELANIGGAPAVSHAGSTGSYRAWLGRFPVQRLSVALLCNSGAVNTEELGPAVAALFLPAVPADRVASAAFGATPAGLAGLYRNTANDAVVTVSDKDGIHFNDGPRFAMSNGMLSTADGQRSATVTRARGGGVLGITLSRVANAPVRLVPVAPWKPTDADLAPFVGSFQSKEVTGVQRIVQAGGALTWIDPAGDRHLLQPIYRNAFEAPDVSWTLRFQRDGSGRAAAVDYSITRARRLSFERTAAGR